LVESSVRDVFQPIPAIDIRGGRCVRLVQGDYARERVFADDPVEMARHWADQGAPRLHVVDLDGARDGARANRSSILGLLQAVSIPVQVGGGVRSLPIAQALLDQGADRVVVGTTAAEDPHALRSWVDALGAERLVIGVDARNGLVATRGWTETTELDAAQFCHTLADLGVIRILYTDISRDGTLEGPNLPALQRLLSAEPRLQVLASGGVSSVDDLRALAEAGAEGAIIGTALYDGRLTLGAVLAAC
jgi:phosphoribosylformimino-5-aminoimidazole carboxamide ribotide isomerase